MGCNCGGGVPRTIAQRTRETAFRAAGSPLGFSDDQPHLLGAEGGEVRRVRVLKKGVDGLSVGQAAYVTGSLVDQLIRVGALHDITKTRQKSRLWKVNGFTYTSEMEARRVADSLGVKPVEVA